MKRTINPVFLRIALRYGAGALAGYSLLPKDITDMLANDPELVGLAAVVVGAGVEGFYVIAKRLGWRT
ncbi:hypothetical protein JJB09_25685 [Rhizobium sp. KVB221]|uniref:Uncharacterized protein n=1 Tax=Rhizobium setariae TaxID=2801340 RepID=A0A936YWB5_9HYPH|nr:hypothetical protein [Rhizobium setariae]MBL0375406.1 hypothetical protein [Rhizobium setariae]